MKKLFFIAILMLGIGVSSNLNAQKYTSAVGLRFGAPLSVSYKMFISEATAIEVYASYRTNNVNFLGVKYGWTSIGVNGAYLIHKDFDNTEGLSWYYGGGASLFFWSYDSGYTGNNGSISFGVSGYIGLDYKFENAPVNISLDWVPTFFIGSNSLEGFGAGQGALAVRYILGY